MHIYQFILAHPILIGLISFIIGFAAMPLVVKIAKTKHFVVKPNKRMCHTGEIPNIGGLDICFSFLFAYLMFEYNQLTESQFILIGVFAIVVVGFVDDILDLSPLSKLFGELLAGVALIGFAGIRITNLHGIFGIGEISMTWSYVLSFFILAAIINAINLIDGVDGLASGLGMLYCLFFALYFQLIGEQTWASLGYSLIGSLAVFFIYNVFGHKRKIFMGDSGSLLLGYIMTAFVFQFCEMNVHLALPNQFHMAAAPAVAICVLSVPIFDTMRVMLTRIKHHKSPFLPDKNHIHHLLLKAGLNHLQTTCVLLSATLLFTGLAIIGRNWNIWLLLGTDFALCSVLTYTLWRFVDRANARKQQESEPITEKGN